MSEESRLNTERGLGEAQNYRERSMLQNDPVSKAGPRLFLVLCKFPTDSNFRF